jgi:hypothetical protein
VAFISASDTIPLKERVGVALILSENVAVIVTTSELETRLSESVSVSKTVGATKSALFELYKFKIVEEVSAVL